MSPHFDMNCKEGRETELLEMMMQRYAEETDGGVTERGEEIEESPSQSTDEPETSRTTPPTSASRLRPKSRRGEIAKEKHLARMQRIRGNK